jgi:hypothetical protein
LQPGAKFRWPASQSPLEVAAAGAPVDSFEDLALFADLAPPPRVDLRRSKTQPFRRADGTAVAVLHPLTKAAVSHLGRRYRDALRVAELVSAARPAAATTGDARYAEETERLFAELFTLFLHQRVGASTQAEAFPRGGRLPRLAELGRAQIEAGLGHIATPRHITLALDPLAQRLVLLLDGTRDLERLTAALTAEIERTRASLTLPCCGGSAALDPPHPPLRPGAEPAGGDCNQARAVALPAFQMHYTAPVIHHRPRRPDGRRARLRLDRPCATSRPAAACRRNRSARP